MRTSRTRAVRGGGHDPARGSGGVVVKWRSCRASSTRGQLGDTGKMTSLASGFVGVWGRSIDDRLGCGDCGGRRFRNGEKGDQRNGEARLVTGIERPRRKKQGMQRRDGPTCQIPFFLI